MSKMFFFSQYICLFLNLMFKHDDEWKRIHDFSYFKNNSINENIIENTKFLKYVTFDKIIAIFIFQKRDVVMFKKNFVNAFKHISIIFLNRWLLDFEWMKIYYMKLFLSFDLCIVFFYSIYLLKRIMSRVWINVILIN